MMPGGFARCAPDSDQLCVSLQTGGCGKDVWVVPDCASDGESATPSLSTTPEAGQTRLLSAAASICPAARPTTSSGWGATSRGIRRDCCARPSTSCWKAVARNPAPACRFAASWTLAAGFHALDRSGHRAVDSAQIDANIQCVLNDASNQNSLVNTLGSIERITESLKDRLSIDSWKRIRSIRQLAVRAAGLEVSIYEPESDDFLESALEQLGSLISDITENMIRSQSWIFMQMGRHIERGLTTAQLMDEVFLNHEQLSPTLLRRVLDLSDCSITYRRRYLNNLNAAAVLDILVFDPTNPRSLIFQAERLRDLLKKLPHASIDSRHPMDAYATQLFGQIGMTSAEELMEQLCSDDDARVREFFSATIEKMTRLSVMVETGYFAHTEAIKPRLRSILG